MTDSDRTPLAPSSLSLFPRFAMSGELSGAGTDGSSNMTPLSSVPSSRLACRSTKNCRSPAPKASPSTFSTVQVRSLKTDRKDGKEFNKLPQFRNRMTLRMSTSQRTRCSTCHKIIKFCTHTSQSTARMSEMSLVGSPTASKMMARVNTPPAGIPAAPTLDAVAVTLTLGWKMMQLDTTRADRISHRMSANV